MLSISLMDFDMLNLRVRFLFLKSNFEQISFPISIVEQSKLKFENLSLGKRSIKFSMFSISSISKERVVNIYFEVNSMSLRNLFFIGSIVLVSKHKNISLTKVEGNFYR